MDSKIKSILSMLLCLMLLLSQFAFALDEADVKAGEETADNGAVATETQKEETNPSEEKKAEPAKEDGKPAEKTEESAKEEAKPAEKESKESKPAFSGEAKLDGVKVAVKAAEGVFPEGAKLSVKRVSKDNQKKVDKAVDAARDDNLNVATVYSFDIKVLDKDGKEVQPADKKKVAISFKLDEADNANLDATIYHLEDTKNGLKAEGLKTKTDKDVVSAETDGFSYYTVEFTYNDLQYVMDGDTSIALADILAKVGLDGEVSDVKVSNAELFSAEKKDDKWMVTAHKAFTSKEWMKVTIDGVIYEIVVTDDVPGNVVDRDVVMFSGQEKAANFRITTGTVLGPNNSGTATIRDCTVTNDANNGRTGQVSGSSGSAFIAQKPNNLLFDYVTINTSTKSLVINIWASASAEIMDTTLNGAGTEWGNVPFLLIGAKGGGSGTLNVSGNSTIKNTNAAIAGGNGSSIINVKSGGILTIKDSKIALQDNVHFVVKSDATLVLDNTTLDVTGSSAVTAITVEEGGKLILQNGSSIKATAAKDFDKGIIVSSGTVEIKNSTISDITKNSGNSSIIEVKKGDLTITDSTFENNNSPNAKGGVVLVNNAGTVTIDGSTQFNNNKSGNAQIYVGQSTALNISDEASFTGNSSTVSGDSYGGAVWAYKTPVTIDDGVTFEKNTAKFGGAVYLQECTGTTIGKATFKGNGTVFETDDWPTIQTMDGGAVYVREGNAEFNGTVFEENIAATESNSSGGAAYIYNAVVDINGAKFTSNTALIYGGALTVAHGSRVTILDLEGDPTEFNDNLVEYGTDFAGGGLFINNAYVKMEDAAIHGNAADDAGGGISTCTTGTAEVRVRDGAAIFDNEILAGDHEHGSGFYPPVEDVQNYQDVFFQTKDHKDADTGEIIPGRDGFPTYAYELYERMFNGGLHNWNAKPIKTVNDEGKNLNSLVAQSNPTNKDTSKAKVVFTGNQAWRHPSYTQTVSGGAIGCNGLLEIGTSTEIKIVKLWDDKDNTSNRPSKNDFLKSVKILADGEEIDKDGLLIDVITKDVEKYVLYNNIANEDGESVDFGDKEPWLIIVSGLPKYSDEDGELEIKYTIKEDDIANYKLVKNEGDMETYFELENKIELIEIPVDKIWDDKNDDAVLRPNSVDVKLFADGEDTGKVITLKKDNNWKGKFEKLFKYDGEREIEYSVEEVREGNLEYYTTEISGDAKEGFTITNSLEVLSDVEATGVKNWVGDKKKDRPKSITIQLLENGTPLEDVILEVTPDASGDWTYCFSAMPRYRNGEEIQYSVKELNVPKGYRAESDGFNLTNTYTGTKPKSKGADTGDNNPALVLIAILAVCAAAITGLIIKRRKQG